MSTFRRLGGARPTPVTAVPAAPAVSDTPTLPPASPPAAISSESRLPEGSARPKRWIRGDSAPIDKWQEMTDRVVHALEAEVLPWRGGSEAAAGWPMNGVTGRPYHGVNIPLLMLQGRQDDRWTTFKMAKEQGWHVKRGEKGTPIYWFAVRDVVMGIDPVTDEPVTRKRPVLQRHVVFNYSQIEGAPSPTFREVGDGAGDGLERVRLLVEELGAVVVPTDRASASYDVNADTIFMPELERFQTEAGYVGALMRHLVHWTGHPERGNRRTGMDRNDPGYAREELRAELASIMLCAKLGVPYRYESEDHSALAIRALLEGDNKELYRAARDAERIAISLLGAIPELRAEISEEAAAVALDADEQGLNEFFDASMFDVDDDLVIDRAVATAGWQP